MTVASTEALARRLMAEHVRMDAGAAYGVLCRGDHWDNTPWPCDVYTLAAAVMQSFRRARARATSAAARATRDP